MDLRDEMARSGNYLFRWRSYLPLLFLPVLLLALRNFSYLMDSELADDAWEVLCFGVAICGLVVRALAVGFAPARTSGRNTKQQQADTLNTTGMYGVVRHPLYLGNFLIWLGVVLFPHTLWLVLIAILAFWIYYERIMFAEEEFLRTRFGNKFEEWARRTRAIVPAFGSWRAPALPFSWKSVLARENTTLLAIVVTFFALEVIGDFVVHGIVQADFWWLALLLAELVFYAVVRGMKKRGMLAVEGR